MTTCATNPCTYPPTATAPDGLPACAECATDWPGTTVPLIATQDRGTLGIRYERTTNREDTHVQPTDYTACQLEQRSPADLVRELEQLNGTTTQPHTYPAPADNAGALRCDEPVDNPGEPW